VNLAITALKTKYWFLLHFGCLLISLIENGGDLVSTGWRRPLAACSVFPKPLKKIGRQL